MPGHFLKSVIFKQDYRMFKEGQIIEFHPGITLFVGNQGVGKTTLCNLLQGNQATKDKLVTDCSQCTNVFSFDAERDNPRISNDLNTLTVQKAISRLYLSHGETIFEILKRLDKESNCIFVQDEPESGLSLQSQCKVLEMMKRAIDRGCQIITSTHSFVFILGLEEVFDLGTMSYMNSKEYLEQQFEENKEWIEGKMEQYLQYH